MASVVRSDLASCEGFRLESSEGLLGWIEETWLDASNEPVAFAIRTVDGREGLLLGKDVDAVTRDFELVTMRGEASLLELDLPRVETASSNGSLSASWRTTGEPLDPPPHPPGTFDRALLAIRPWRLAPPPVTGAERPLGQQLVVLYTAVTLIVLLVIGLSFLVARLVTGSAI